MSGILDELEHLPFSPSSAAFLLHLLSKLYERARVVIEREHRDANQPGDPAAASSFTRQAPQIQASARQFPPR